MFDFKKKYLYNEMIEMKVGSCVWFQLIIMFLIEDIDMLVEFFILDNEIIVMILCDVNVMVIGSSFMYNGSKELVMDFWEFDLVMVR